MGFFEAERQTLVLKELVDRSGRQAQHVDDVNPSIGDFPEAPRGTPAHPLRCVNILTVENGECRGAREAPEMLLELVGRLGERP
jgi:hypothetical protein